MANWARLQEQLTGLPVVKRAKHSIHFDKGNGEIVANFSGARCHYEDKGVWKPIDTTLLLGADGFYGCPHSPVKVHKDGRVKVDKSDYSQFTKLPGSPLGRVDGDKIVREFPGGYQELFVTEDGFREVITVVKRTFPIEKFLAKQSGTLPSAYKTSPQTAVDANGNEFVITADTKAFGDWLEGAVYPVVIDPDFSTGVVVDVSLREAYPTRHYGLPISYQNNRNLIRFDCSSIPSTATATAVSLLTTKETAMGTNSAVTANFYSVASANSSWTATASTNSPTAGQSTWGYKHCYLDAELDVLWAGSDGLGTSGTDYEATVLCSTTWNRADEQYYQYTCTFNAAGITRIQGWFGATNTNYGLLFTQSSGVARPCASGNATASYRPVLTVTYTAAGGLLRRTNMNAQMSNLTGGMHG